MPDIRHAIKIAAPSGEVLPLVATAAGLRRWWAEDVTEAEEGAVAELGFFDRATVYRLLKTGESPGRVVWRAETGDEWRDTTLEFELAESGGATELQFAHRGWAVETPYFVSCNTTWGGLMFRLAGAAEGREPGPLFGRSSLAY